MIIGLAGAKGSGKNLAAKFIAEEFSNRFEIKEWSFAAKLKHSAACIFDPFMTEYQAVAWANSIKSEGWCLKLENSKTGESWWLSGREYLQRYGTEAHRNIFGTDFWVNSLANEIEDHYGDYYSEQLNLITDLRFDNETHVCNRVIKIRRPEVENSGDTHASEKPLPDDLVSYEVWNDGTYEQFKERVIDTMEEAILSWQL